MRTIITTRPARTGARFVSWEQPIRTEYWVSAARSPAAWQLAGVRQTRRGLEEFWAPCSVADVAAARQMTARDIVAIARLRSVA